MGRSGGKDSCPEVYSRGLAHWERGPLLVLVSTSIRDPALAARAMKPRRGGGAATMAAWGVLSVIIQLLEMGAWLGRSQHTRHSACVGWAEWDCV